MTKIRKKVVLATRQTKTTKSAVKNIKRKLTQAEHKAAEAEMEEQIAQIEARRAESEAQYDAQIAALRAQYEEERVAVPLGSPLTYPNADLVASLNAQVAAIQRQIAALTGGDQALGYRPETGGMPQAYSLPPTASSLQPQGIRKSLKPRVQLPQPEITFMQATDPHTILVKWNAVPNAASYSFKYSTDPNVMLDVEAKYPHATDTQVTLDALLPNTTYYAHIKANAGAGNTESAYSITKAATTPAAGSGGGDNGGEGGTEGGETAGNLQSWLNELKSLNKHFRSLLGYPTNTAGIITEQVLSPAERQRLRGSGVRRYGYVDKVSDIASENPQFWPAFIDGDDTISGAEQMKTLIREIEVLRNLLIAFRNGEQNAEDMLLIAGNAAFRLANFYYRNVRDATRNNIAGAANVFDMLQQFWNKPRRKTSDKPTEAEVERDLHALEHGTAEGELYVANKSDTTIKGEKTVVDNVRRRSHDGMKVEEREERE